MIWAIGLCLAGPVADMDAALTAGESMQAIELAEASMGAGQGSSGLYSNLSHAHYQRGDLPRAIGAMRQASQLAPRSSAIQYDLALMRSEAKVTRPVQPSVFWTKLMTPGEAGVLVCLLMFFASAWVLYRRKSLDVGVVAGFGTTMALTVYVLWSGFQVSSHPVAVVVDQAIKLRDGPAISAGLRHELNPGQEVRIERGYAGFSLVTDGLGRRGWAPNSSLWVVYPSRGRSVGPSDEGEG